MLTITNIKKSFGDNAVLVDINLEAQEGALTVIEGKNGAGKSTLFNILCGLVDADAGTIMLNDVAMHGLSAINRAPYLAIIRQDPGASSVLTFSLLDNFALAMLKGRRAQLTYARNAKTIERAHAHLLELGLDFARDLQKPLRDFSGGQRQIIAFAMATLHHPSLLLLDEPTAALDEHAAITLMETVKRLIARFNIPAIMISHDHDINKRYADAIYLLADGHLRR